MNNQGECETCGRWSSDLKEGMCPCCIDKFKPNKESKDD